MNVLIKKATINDVDIANQYLTKLIRDEKQYDKNINENCVVNSFYENVINNENSIVLLAFCKNVAIGYLYGYVKNNGDAYLDKVSQLEAMYVDNEYRHMGVGNCLINQFKNWSKNKGVRFIDINVCKDNINAIMLYQKNDFNVNKYSMTLELK